MRRTTIEIDRMYKTTAPALMEMDIASAIMMVGVKTIEAAGASGSGANTNGVIAGGVNTGGVSVTMRTGTTAGATMRRRPASISPSGFADSANQLR